MKYNLENVRITLYEYKESIRKFLNNNTYYSYEFKILDNVYQFIILYCRNL